MEKTPDKSYNVAMPDSYYDGKKFCSIGEKYGPFALMDVLLMQEARLK